MGNIEFLSAAEARKITDESSFLLNSVYKWIKDAAKHNNSSTGFCTECYDSTIVDYVLDNLRASGYKIEIADEEGLAVNICW